jgi:hypothetical protein
MLFLGTAAVAALVVLIGTRAGRSLPSPSRAGQPTGPQPSMLPLLPVIGVLAGLALQARIPGRLAVVGVGAAVLGLVGFVADRRGGQAHALRVSAELGAAVLAVVAGVRLELTGVRVPDDLLTAAWLVGVTRAIVLMDKSSARWDGRRSSAATGGSAHRRSQPHVLSGLLISAMAATMFVLARASDRSGVAGIAAGLIGANVAFALMATTHRACGTLGWSGCAPLGYLLAAATLEADTGLSATGRLVVPLLLVVVPLANAAVVVAGRARRRLPVSVERDDHLWHRLVAQGAPPKAAGPVLVLSQVTLGGLAVLAGRDVVRFRWAVVSSMVLLVWLVVASATHRVHGGAVVVGWPRWVRVGGGLLILIGIGVSVPGMMALVAARRPAQAGEASARAGLDAAHRGDLRAAAAAFAEADLMLSRAHLRLSGWLPSLAVAVPVLSPNYRAARTLVDVGLELSRRGRRLAEDGTGGGLAIQSGRVPLDEVARISPDLTSAATELGAGVRRVRSVDQPLLFPPIARAVSEARARIEPAVAEETRAASAAQLAPDILGGNGPRRYFLAVQNNAELRGTGGFMGSFGELVIDAGAVRLERLGRLDELRFFNGEYVSSTLPAPPEMTRRYGRYGIDWKHVNISPDFPAVARTISEVYPRSGGRPVDGVIAIDLPGLAKLMELTGPVTLASWDEPLTTANVVDVLARDSVQRYPTPAERADFLSGVTGAIFQALTRGQLGEPSKIAQVLGQAARARHVMLYFTRVNEQRLARWMNVDGAIPHPAGDSFFVVNNNGAGNKADYYLTRRLRYTVVLHPRGEEIGVDARAELTLLNATPSSGLSSGIIGPNDQRFQAGENLSLTALYSPQILRRSTLDGRPVMLGADRELGRNAYDHMLDMHSNQSATLAVSLSGSVARPGGWYLLQLVHQPTLRADEVDVSFEVPAGWRIAATRGIDGGGEAGRRVTAAVSLESDRTIGVRLERTGLGGLWDRLRFPRDRPLTA